MISVCIPVYNYCVVPLATALAAQAKSLDCEVELVFVDDASSAAWREKNAPLEEMGRYVQLEENIGRARIRNLFLQYTAGDYLLFLDNDSVIRDGFLSRYASWVDRQPSVVVGGRVYDRKSDSPDRHLRYLYGVQAESHDAAFRSQQPYRSFMTNNFMVARSVFDQVRFDERLSLYGHEDTLFGYRLSQAGIPIVHIDNPVVNGDVETNDDFLRKTDEAIQNLVLLMQSMHDDQGFIRSVRLLDTWQRLANIHMEGLVLAIYKVMRQPLLSHFRAGNAISLAQFNFYKLGLFIDKLKHNQNSQTKLITP